MNKKKKMRVLIAELVLFIVAVIAIIFWISNEKKEIIGMKAGDISNLKRTFDALISAGLEMEEALPLFTSNVAFANGFNTKGRICEGYDADIAVYDGKDLRFLFANGQAMVWERKEKKGIYEQ